ncbi:MAG TPA: ABC transporter substrate-binding protein [Steroidobacteraceae bacterium]|jgi:iron complex transport system substrate-binding protein|nr:ABC transporter substrate-binding protein [Steroidobacteraceae bacterium]
MSNATRLGQQLHAIWLVCIVVAPLAGAGTLPAAPATRQITDAAGRIVTFPSSVNRVADPWHANNAMVLMLGGAGKLVATTAQARNQPWLRKLYPPIEQVPAAFNAAGEINIETLIGTRPDVILMAYGGALPGWLEAVEAYHVPVIMLPNGSLEGLKTTVRMTGEVLGQRESAMAAEYIRYFDDNILRVTKVTSQLLQSERPRVLHTATAGILTVDGRQSVIDDWITVAGGINVADFVGLARPVTMEQVAAWDPDVVIVGTAPNQQNRQAILDDPRWSGIKAVKTGKVFVNPSGAYLWDRHSAEAALQVLWAAKLLHPARFAELDVNRETKRFYARFFHHVLTDAELASIMNATAP